MINATFTKIILSASCSWATFILLMHHIIYQPLFVPKTLPPITAVAITAEYLLQGNQGLLNQPPKYENIILSYVISAQVQRYA